MTERKENKVLSLNEKSIVDLVCFFFQAEDGIRDTSVTGVQTCALPISTMIQLYAAISFAKWIIVVF